MITLSGIYCRLTCGSEKTTFCDFFQTFGKDLLVTICILIGSIIFGFYLLVTFSIFITCDKRWVFITTYSLYAFIPSLRSVQTDPVFFNQFGYELVPS
jgi:hypothetical protein